MSFITVKEFEGKYGISKQVISQKINGFHRKYKPTGKIYFYPPVLEKGKHYKWEDGILLVNKSSINVLTSKQK